MPRPPLTDEWLDEFVVQARLYDVPGPRIGDALAEIDAHCAESGQSPEDAFGDPRSYAQTLAQSQSATATTGGLRLSCMAGLMTVGAVGGIACAMEGASAVFRGVRGVLTAGDLMGILAATVAIVYIAAVVLRPGRRHVGTHLVSAVVLGFVLSVLPWWWRRPVLHVGSWLLLTTGLLLLALVWWSTHRIASDRSDRIIDPRSGQEVF